MDFSEPENWARIRREAEEFTAAHVTREVIEHERRTGDGVDRALTRKLGERGWIRSRRPHCGTLCAKGEYRPPAPVQPCCRPTRSVPPARPSSKTKSCQVW